MRAEIRVQSDPFDYGKESAVFAEAANGAGAVVTFLGLVRDSGGKLSRMEIEDYPGMTEKALAAIAAEAAARWSLDATLIIPRYGVWRPN